nr:PREDICTED: transmembrane protein 217 [Lepisosteus oculatus]
MKIYLSKGLCGMSPRTGTIVGGLYFLMVGTMQLVFQCGHLHKATIRVSEAGTPLLPVQCQYYYYALLGLDGATLLLAGLMLGSVWARRAAGLLGFAAWMILYEVASAILLALLEVEMQAAGSGLRPLEWFGVGCRLFCDPFWLALVVTHGLELHQEGQRRLGGQRQRAGPVVRARGAGGLEGTSHKLKFKAFDSHV